MFVLGLILPFEVFGFVFGDGRRVFLPLSTLGRRAAGGPCREDGFDDDIVDVGCLRADEAAPGRDCSSSDPDWDAVEDVPRVVCGVLKVLERVFGRCGAGGAVIGFVRFKCGGGLNIDGCRL